MNTEFVLRKVPSSVVYIFIPIFINVLLNLCSSYINEVFRISFIFMNGIVIVILAVKTGIDLYKEYVVVLSPEGVYINKIIYSIEHIREIRIGDRHVHVLLFDENKKRSFSVKAPPKTL